MPNFKSVVHFLVVDFGEGCRSRSRSCCDRGKTKSTPSPFDLDWNGLGLEFDNKSFQQTLRIKVLTKVMNKVVNQKCEPKM